MRSLPPDPAAMRAQALKALEADERDADAWRALGQAQEQAGDWRTALDCYWAALRLRPEHDPWLDDVRRAGERAGDLALAEGMLRSHLAARPASEPANRTLAAFLRDHGRAGEAIALLRQAIPACPRPASLHNQLAALLAEDGWMREAEVEVEAALAIAPGWPAALQNRSIIRLALGDAAGAVNDLDAAIAGAPVGPGQASMRLARALALISAGRIAEGWAAYAARLDPDYAGSIRFDIPLPRWRPGQSLEGLRLLLVGEQGLGDEIMFASLAPDALQLTARLGLAVIPRLAPIFQRSFPGVLVTHHHTRSEAGAVHRSVPEIGAGDFDAFAPMADLLTALRPGLAAFPKAPGYLAPDPGRVARWRGALADLPPGPKIGLTWKSLNALWGRGRYFAPFEAWRPLFQAPGVTVACLQYGDVSREADLARAWGGELWIPPGLDIQNDLEGMAGLMTALDQVVGSFNGTTTFAGALGVPTTVATVREAWQMLGSGALPWFPQARVFTVTTPNAWDEATGAAIASMLGTRSG